MRVEGVGGQPIVGWGFPGPTMLTAEIFVILVDKNFKFRKKNLVAG